LPAGTHAIAASYSGDGIFASSAAQLTLVIAKAATSVAISQTPNPIPVGAPVSVTATVTTPATIIAALTSKGTITFAEGSNVLFTTAASFGGPSVGGTATATFTTSTLGAGTHTIAVQYSGDSDLAASTATATVVIQPPDFSMAAASGGSTTQSVAAGQTATYNLSLAPAGGFSGTVSLACTGAPATTTCTVNPSSVNLSGSAAVPFTVTVATTARSSVVSGPVVGSNMRPKSWSPFGVSTSLAALLGMLLGPLAMVLIGGGRSNKLRKVALAVTTVALMGVIACGGGGSSSTPTPKVTGTAAGSYTLVVTATSGATTHSTNLTLNVQ
jgi:Bacterial Ig-like domain (group 3)